MTIELSEYVIDAIADAVVKKMQEPSYNSIKTELEPCEDAISREKALQIIRAWFDGDATPSDLKNEIEQLPPVTPQPKSGYLGMGAI